jgi:hypothetical protein
MTSEPASQFKKESGFSITQWVLRNSKTTTPTGKLISAILADRWKPGGEVYLKVETIMKLSNIKSKQTVLNALIDIEDAGEWAVIRREGYTSQYIPMFVEDADQELLAKSIQDRTIRKVTDHNNKDVAKVRGPKDPAQDVVTPKNMRVKTPEDQAVLDAYTEHQEYRNDDPDYDYPLPPDEFPVVEFITSTGANEIVNERNPRGYFVKGAHDRWFPELAGQWINDYGFNFGPTVTYSTIQKVYDELCLPDAERNSSPMDLDTANVAIRLLGSKRKMPTAKFIRRVMFADAAQMEDDQLELRYLIQATVRGIEETRRLAERNFYRTRK